MARGGSRPCQASSGTAAPATTSSRRSGMTRRDDDTDECPYCRRSIYDDAVQCPYCGNYLCAGGAAATAMVDRRLRRPVPDRVAMVDYAVLKTTSPPGPSRRSAPSTYRPCSPTQSICHPVAPSKSWRCRISVRAAHAAQRSKRPPRWYIAIIHSLPGKCQYVPNTSLRVCYKCQYVPNRPISPGSPGWAVDNPLPGSAVDWTAPCAAG